MSEDKVIHARSNEEIFEVLKKDSLVRLFVFLFLFYLCVNNQKS
jgi:hypothetical protein